MRELQKKLLRAKRIALIGIGSELRGDDAAGMLVAKNLEGFKPSKKSRLKVFFGSSAPENITGEVKKFKPTHLIIVDAADMGKGPGQAQLLLPQDESAGFSFSTHKMPIRVMLDYLKASCGCETMLIGIQPKEVGFAALPSREVRTGVRRLCCAIKGILG
jgi:hydrogenase 3 maturation protease